MGWEVISLRETVVKLDTKEECAIGKVDSDAAKSANVHLTNL